MTLYPNLICPFCLSQAKWIGNFGAIDQYRCVSCDKTFTIKDKGEELVRVTFNN